MSPNTATQQLRDQLAHLGMGFVIAGPAAAAGSPVWAAAAAAAVAGLLREAEQHRGEGGLWPVAWVWRGSWRRHLDWLALALGGAAAGGVL